MKNEKAIRILQKVKYHQECFRVIPKCSGRDCPFNGGYGSRRCHDRRCNAYIESFLFEPFDLEGYGVTWFDTREKAERKLQMMGGCKDGRRKEM